MSNQSVDDFEGCQPFITDKEYQNLSLYLYILINGTTNT